MRRVALDGYDMTLDGRIGLNLYRDGRRPAVQGGKFGPTEQMRNPGGLEQAVVMDRFDGGVGAVERMVPNTYPLAIDGCTRFSRAWTPSGEIIELPPFEPYLGGRPGRIRSILPWRDTLVVGSGQVFYLLGHPYLDPVPMGRVGDNEEIQDLLEFEGVLVAGTTRTDGTPGRLWAYDEPTLTWICDPLGLCTRQHLVKSYQVIDDVGAFRLTANDTPYSFRFVATGGAATAAALVDDTTWVGLGAGGEHLYPVGDKSARITNLAGRPLGVFFCKEDGVYHVGPDG